MKVITTKRSLLASIAFLSCLPNVAVAQSAVEATSQDVGIADIIVTARKREENLQDTPASVSALSSEALQKAGIDDFAEIASRVPGFTLNPDNVSEPNVFLRGIGTDIESAAASPAVGFFLNEVYLSRAQGTAIELFDFERIEVVRGPQGTLYGKNVVGGAINFITRKPTDEFRAYFEGTLGNYKALEARGGISGGITDGLSGSISISARRREGFAFNTFTKNDIEDLSSFGILGQLRYQPNDTLDILLTGDLTRRRSAGRWVDILIPSTHNIPFKNPDPRRGPNNIDGRQDADLGGLHLTASLDVGAGTVTSISAYREATFDVINNDAGSFIDFNRLVRNANGRVNFFAINRRQFNDDYYINSKLDKVKTFSQELRFNSEFDGPFNFLAGVYYLYEDVNRLEDADYLFVNFFAEGRELSRTTTKANTYAAFAEGTYDLTDRLSLTAGIRYTKDTKIFSVNRAAFGDFLGQDFTDALGNPVTAFSGSDRRGWSSWTPSATIEWKPSDDFLFYGLISKGYKSGGWNGEEATNPTEIKNSYNPEFAWNYEIGAKTDLLDKRLRFNLTGFWTEYRDLQTQQFVLYDPNLPPDNVVSNAGRARVRGVEIETVAIPVKGLTLYGNYTYMEGKITGDLISTALVFDLNCFCQVPVPTNLKGNGLRRTPKHTFNVGGDVDVPLNENLNGFIRANYSWTDKFFFDNENSPRTTIDAIGVLNGSIGVGSPDGDWEVSLWGKNLTNELYVSGKTDVIGSVLVSYAPPRTYGATLRYRF